LILVILVYPDSQRRHVILDGIPARGDTILVKGERRSLMVEHRLWMEKENGGIEPATLISVRPVPDLGGVPAARER
jgi:hypothetical protein